MRTVSAILSLRFDLGKRYQARRKSARERVYDGNRFDGN